MNIQDVDWDAVSAIAATLALIVNIVVAYSLVIAIRGVQEAERAKESTIFIWALDRVREIRPLMNEVKQHPRDLDWLKGRRDEILKMLEILQMITFMAEEGVIDRDRIIGMWGKSIVEQWICLEPFVIDFRRSIGEPGSAADGAFFARSFEQFAARSRTNLGGRFRIDWTPLENPAPSLPDTSPSSAGASD